MFSLLQKDILLNRVFCISFIFAGAINFDGKRWFPIFTAYQILSTLYVIITTVVEIIIGSREVNDIVATLSTTLAGFMGLVKLLNFVSKTNEIRHILKRLELIYWKMLENEDSKHIILEAENFGRKMSVAIIVVLEMMFAVAVFIIAGIREIMTNFNEKRLLLKIWIPWNKENIWVYLLTNAWLTLLTITCLSIYAAFFIMELTVSLYVAAYIKQLEQKLMQREVNNEELYEQHNLIMQLIMDYNYVLSGQMYLETVVSPLMPCGFALAALRGLQKKDLNQTFNNLVRTFLSLMPCVISCCCGQLILTQMESLHETSYMSNWYEEEPKIRKNILIMMTKTTSPTTVNYRLYVKFDHVLLSAVLQVIYSYFTLMLNLDEG